MNDHEYGFETELDESLGIPGRDRYGTMDWLKSIERERERTKARKVGYDLFSGTRQYLWTMKIPGGGEVQGKIMIPLDEAPHPDLATKMAFEIVFRSVKAVHFGSGRFEALVEGRKIGSFALDPQMIQREVYDVFGDPSYQYAPRGQAERQWEHAALGWLRSNIEFTLSDGKETYPPYEPKLPKKSKGMPVAQAAQNWSQELATARKPKDTWVPLNQGQNMAAIGVNLSSTSGGGATNMAFATQLEQAHMAGQAAHSKDHRAAPVIQMHLEGKVIG